MKWNAILKTLCTYNITLIVSKKNIFASARYKSCLPADESTEGLANALNILNL